MPFIYLPCHGFLKSEMPLCTAETMLAANTPRRLSRSDSHTAGVLPGASHHCHSPATSLSWQSLIAQRLTLMISYRKYFFISQVELSCSIWTLLTSRTKAFEFSILDNNWQWRVNLFWKWSTSWHRTVEALFLSQPFTPLLVHGR